MVATKLNVEIFFTLFINIMKGLWKMNNNFLRLEYDKILEILSPYCKTFKGKELVNELRPNFE